VDVIDAINLYELATEFPSLADAQPPEPSPDLQGQAWVTAFALWAGETDRGDGAMWAALFVLSVWNNRTQWHAYGEGLHGSRASLGRFDMHTALGAWDGPHRRAFAEWASDPWWC